jgi:hypothetical protein
LTRLNRMDVSSPMIPMMSLTVSLRIPFRH